MLDNYAIENVPRQQGAWWSWLAYLPSQKRLILKLSLEGNESYGREGVFGYLVFEGTTYTVTSFTFPSGEIQSKQSETGIWRTQFLSPKGCHYEVCSEKVMWFAAEKKAK